MAASRNGHLEVARLLCLRCVDPPSMAKYNKLRSSATRRKNINNNNNNNKGEVKP